jgi:hypothetical protein
LERTVTSQTDTPPDVRVPKPHLEWVGFTWLCTGILALDEGGKLVTAMGYTKEHAYAIWLDRASEASLDSENTHEALKELDRYRRLLHTSRHPQAPAKSPGAITE